MMRHRNICVEVNVRLTRLLASIVLASATSLPALAQGPVHARPDPVSSEVVTGMPRGERQEISVMSATFQPGQRTVFHSHRFPVTVYILEGAFTLELEGRAPVVIRAGQAYVEPPGVKMTGYNRSSSELLKLVIFYVADPGTPFLDLAH
jgi:quercetin dioxygenase-like cupin family protein